MDGRPGPWGVVAVGAFGVRMLVRFAKRSDDVVYRAELKPGESVMIEHDTVTVGQAKKAKGRRAKRRATNA